MISGVDPENGQLRYSISGQYFSVDSLTGVVTLAKTLDREEQAFLEVIISITGKRKEESLILIKNKTLILSSTIFEPFYNF